MAKWKNHSGNEVITNDLPANLDAAKAAGWELVEGPAKAETKADSTTVADVVAAMKTKDEVEAYVQKAFGVDLDKRLSLDKMKAQALELAEEAE